jgi:hypothetical protein
MSSKVGRLGKDVYRDLRDRRLLVIAVALILAIVAVPFLVKGDPPAQVDSAASGVVITEPSELDPVVVAEEVGLRDYRERLDGLHGKNPFEQQLTGSPGGGGSGGGGSGESGGLPTEDSVAATGGSTTSSAGVPAAGVPAASASGTDALPAPDADEGEEPDDPEPTEVTTAVSFSIDIKVGPPGDGRIVRDVRYGDLLPGKDRPILQYVSTDVDGTASSFAVSRQVVGASGEGHCAPNRARCDFLELGVGDEQELELSSGSTPLRIKLLEIIRHERIVREAPPDSA